jgi:hypothetical protein
MRNRVATNGRRSAPIASAAISAKAESPAKTVRVAAKAVPLTRAMRAIRGATIAGTIDATIGVTNRDSSNAIISLIRTGRPSRQPFQPRNPAASSVG